MLPSTPFAIVLVAFVPSPSASAFFCLAPAKVNSPVRGWPAATLAAPGAGIGGQIRGVHPHPRRLGAVFGTPPTEGIAIFDDSADSSFSENSRPSITTHDRKPRLASALQTTLKYLIRILLLGQYSSLAVDVTSDSNRALLLGKLKNLSISVRDGRFRFNLFNFRKWDMNCADLHLGQLPLLLALGLVYWRSSMRLLIWCAIFCRIGGQDSQLPRMLSTLREKLYKMMDVRPSTIHYSLSISENNINKSLLMKFWLNGILRSLVENSVVGAAAAMGDAARQELLKSTKKLPKKTKQPRALGLPGSGSNSAKNEPTGTRSMSNNDTPSTSQTQQKTQMSDLLSATSFEIKDTSFSSDGRVVLEAEAVLPNENGNVSKRALPFAIRAKLEPTTSTISTNPQRQGYDALGFLSPECRLNTTPLTSGSLLGKLIPEVVWVPFGLGVAVPWAANWEIYRAEVTHGNNGKDDMEGMLQIDGSIAVFTP